MLLLPWLGLQAVCITLSGGNYCIFQGPRTQITIGDAVIGNWGWCGQLWPSFFGYYLYFCNAWCIYTGYSGRTTESWAMHVLLHLLENRLGLRQITGNSIRRPGVLCSVSFWDEHRKQAFCVGMNCIVKEQGSSISRMSQGTKSSYIKASKSRLVTRSTQTSPTLPENSTQKYTHDRFSKNKILAWKQQ